MDPTTEQPTTPAQEPDNQPAAVPAPAIPATPIPDAEPTPVLVPEPAPAEPVTETPEPTPIPATESAEPVAAPATPEPVVAATAGAKKRILLVEDDEGLASVYIARLEAEDFDVRHVPNGEEALSNALEYKPDMILLDVMMPKISGFDVLDILRNTPETTNIKIIMLTALSQSKDKERAQSLGVDDYLVKSQVVIADVVDRIKYHLG